MANPHKGEVSFEVEGKQYVLSFSANALCEMEDVLNLGVSEIASRFEQVDKLRIKTVRAVFWAGLTDKHPDLTIKGAGDLIGKLTLPKAIELIGEAFTLAFPAPEASDDPRPRNPGRDGIGLDN